jgi:hypothetical protein
VASTGRRRAIKTASTGRLTSLRSTTTDAERLSLGDAYFDFDKADLEDARASR